MSKLSKDVASVMATISPQNPYNPNNGTYAILNKVSKYPLNTKNASVLPLQMQVRKDA